jgi:hypothetical protein
MRKNMGFLYWQKGTGGFMTAEARELLQPLCPIGLSQIHLDGVDGKGTFAWHSDTLDDHLIAYDSTTQKWVEHPKCKGLYVGYWNHLKPCPQDYAREHELHSMPAVIEGQVWDIPVVFDIITGSSVLPQKHIYKAAGEGFQVVPEVLEQYRPAEESLRAFYNDYLQPLSSGEKLKPNAEANFVDVIVHVLSLTHYIDHGIYNLLDLVTDRNNAGSIILGIALGIADLANQEERTPIVEVN